MKPRRSDADNCERSTRQQDRLPNGFVLTFEPCSPEMLADNHDRRCFWTFILRRQQSARMSRRAEHFKVVAGYECACDRNRAILSADRHYNIAVRGQRSERRNGIADQSK